MGKQVDNEFVKLDTVSPQAYKWIFGHYNTGCV